MSRTTIEFSLTNSQARVGLQRLRAMDAEMAPLMASFAGHLVAGVEESFEREADPDTGIAWAALAPRTIKRRATMGHWPGKKLQVSGALARDIVGQSGDDYAEVVAANHTAPFHFFGTRNMPARRFMGISPQTEDNLLDATLDYIRRLAGG